MQKRILGATGFHVSPLMFGGNVFGWTVDETTAFTLLDAYVGASGNFIDTADMYARWVSGNQGGESEIMIGNWLKKRNNRQDVIIATKVGVEMGPGKEGLSKKYILQAVEDSLARLQTDYIDLYQAHEDDFNTPLEETMDAFTTLKNSGKVRAIGASNYSAKRLREALSVSTECKLAAFETLQPHYNLYDRTNYEDHLAPLCEEYGLGVIPYYSLASGFLTGKYRDEKDLLKSARGNGVRKYLTDRGMRILNALDRVALEYDAEPAQIAIAWLLANPTITAPIASATTVAQLESLIAATNLKLSSDAVQLLNVSSKD